MSIGDVLSTVGVLQAAADGPQGPMPATSFGEALERAELAAVDEPAASFDASRLAPGDSSMIERWTLAGDRILVDAASLHRPVVEAPVVPERPSREGSVQLIDQSSTNGPSDSGDVSPAAAVSQTSPPPSETGSNGSWVRALPPGAEAWVRPIRRAARDAGIDPRLLAAVVWAESEFTPTAVSPAGAIGLAQLMPGTAAGLGVDPWDPEQNLAGGAEYLAWTIERFGTERLGLAAYNAGPGRVSEYGGAPPYTHRYIDRVLGYYQRLGGNP